MQKRPIVRLTESALMIAAATILSLIPIVKMPFGGSVTAFSMLPILLIAYRYGVLWGCFVGVAHGLIQLLLDLGTLQYATTIWAALAIVLLDYLVAFGVLGAGGLFRRRQNQAAGLTMGVLVACVLRYLCHVITGCTVWVGLSIPDSAALLYSLAYNAAYMLPETLITMVGAYYIARVLDFRRDRLTRVAVQHRGGLLEIVGSFALVGCILADALMLFFVIQTEEGFDITRISGANWPVLAIVLVCGLAVFAALQLAVRRLRGRPQTA